MNSQIYTKTGELRKRAPHRYVDRVTREPIPENKLRKIKFPGMTFRVGPNGGSIDENPAYEEWMELCKKEVRQ